MRYASLFLVPIFLTAAGRVQAQAYGWPPPIYSVTGVRASDNYHYRNLRQVLHDRGWGRHRAVVQENNRMAALGPPQITPPVEAPMPRVNPAPAAAEPSLISPRGADSP